MTPCVWRILCLRNSSSVPYFRQPPNLPTAARRNRKCTECVTTAFGRNRMSAESAHVSTFGAETETEIRLTSNEAVQAKHAVQRTAQGHKKRTTKKYLDKRRGERKLMWTGYKYSWSVAFVTQGVTRYEFFLENKNNNTQLSDPETRISFLFARCRPTLRRSARRCCCLCCSV